MTERTIISRQAVKHMREVARDPGETLEHRVAAGYVVFMDGDSDNTVAGHTFGDLADLCELSISDVQLGLAALGEYLEADDALEIE